MVYRGCAIPVAWRILRANQRGAWMDPIVELLRELAPAVPREMTVIVLCDRGISSPKLWQQIRAQGWHPYMRYPKSVTFCAQGGRRLPARAFVPRPDTAWVGTGTAFGAAAAKRRCTLLAVWYVEQEEPWIILTDLPPEEVGVSWYALRFWIELGFKAVKSLGWKWDKTRRTDPARVLPPLAGAVGGHAAGPGLWDQGGRRQRAQDCPGQSPDASQGPAVPAPLPLAEAGTNRQRDPPRHRLAAAVAAPRPPLEPRLAPARTLAGTQTQPGGHPPCPCLKTPYIPLSAGGGAGLRRIRSLYI